MKDKVIHIQNACNTSLPVEETQLETWASAVLTSLGSTAELTIRLVEETEMTDLNAQYRNQKKSTNVLAFPANIPDLIELDIPLLGDIILCPAVLERESREQGKALKHHFAHMVTHGILHLSGYDHIDEEDEKIMQAQEIAILSTFNIHNPYEENRSDT